MSVEMVFSQAVDLVKYKLVRGIDTGDAVMNNTLAVVAGGAVTLSSGWIRTACGAASAYVRARFFPGLDGAARLGDLKDTGLVGDADRVQLRTGTTAVTADVAVHVLTVTDARQLRQLLDWVEVTYPTSCPRSESKRVPGERASWSHVSRRPLPQLPSSSAAASLPSKFEHEAEAAAAENTSVWRRCVRKRRRTQSSSSAPPLSFADRSKTKTTATAAATTPTEIAYVTPRRRTARDLDAICSRYTMFAVWRHGGHAVFLSGARRSEKEREDAEGGDDDDDQSSDGGGGGGGSRSWNLVVRSASADAALHFVMLFRDPTAEQLEAERALVVEAERAKAAAVAAALAASAVVAAASKVKGRNGRRSAIPTSGVDSGASTRNSSSSSSSSSSAPPAEARMPARLQTYMLPEARDPDADSPTQRYAVDIMKLYALRTWPRAKDCQKLNARWSLDAMVFRDKAQIEALVADYERCLKAADPYGCRKIGIIVAGEYGTGKSSLLPALAQRLGMNVVRWDLSASADRDEVRAAFQFAVEQRCIISLDEIDKLLDRLAHPQLAALAAKHARDLADAKELMLALEKVDETKHAQARDAYVRLVAARNKEPVDLAFLQSLLDGVDDSSGRVIVASTNHPERIPPALLRPGRFDVQSRMRHFSGAQTRQLMRLMFLWRTAKTDDGGEEEKDSDGDDDDDAVAAESGREEKSAEKRGDEESKTPRSDRSSLSSLLSLSAPSPPKLEVGDSKNSSSNSGRAGGGDGDDESKSKRREQEAKEEKRSRRTKALAPRGERAVALAAELRQWCGYSERDANAAAWLEEVPLPDGVWSPAQVVSARQKHRTLRATAMYLSTQRPENFSERVVPPPPPPQVSSAPSSSSSPSAASAPANLQAVLATPVPLTSAESADSSLTMPPLPPQKTPMPPTETLPSPTEKLGRLTAGGGAKRRRVEDGEEEEKEE